MVRFDVQPVDRLHQNQRSLRPLLHNGIWLVALKVQIEKAPAGAVESWALFLRQAGGLRIALIQDADLFDEDGGDALKGAAKRFVDGVKRSGCTVTITGAGRSVTIGGVE